MFGETAVTHLIQKILSGGVFVRKIEYSIFGLIRACLSRLYFSQSFFPPHKQAFSVGDYHHRVLIGKSR
jgi:hypothetical protein